MTERIPDICDIYWYASAGNTGRPVHPMCEAMSAASWIGLYVASKITSSGGISGNKSRTGTPAHVLTTPSAAVGASEPVADGKQLQLEYGKRYLRRDGKVSGALEHTNSNSVGYSVSHPFWDAVHCLSYRADGGYNVSEVEDKFDLIAEYHEPEQSPPAESPEKENPLKHINVGRIEGLQHVLDCIHSMLTAGRNAVAAQALAEVQTVCLAAIQRINEGSSLSSTSQVDASPPAESPDDWVTQDRFTMRECDQIRWIDVDTDLPCCNPLGEWADVGISRYVSHGFVDCGKYRLEIRCRRKDLPVKAPVTKTPSSIDLNADKPRMRTIELSEHRYNHSNKMTVWSSRLLPDMYTTGRTAVVEVPE